MNANSIPLTPVKSSQLAAIGHDAATNTLAIQFLTKGRPGNVYHYRNFTAADYSAFVGAESVGSYFGKHIKPFDQKYPFTNMGVPLAAPVAAAVDLIGPLPVERCKDGYWSHPGTPDFDEDFDAFNAWFAAQGLESKHASLEDEDLDHPAYIAYFDNEAESIISWAPTPPEGDGWFTFSIHDTEDGPMWFWARRVPVPA